MKNLDPTTLEYSWTAMVRLTNGHHISIWWTAWYGMKKSVEEIISISSDYPRYKISESKFLS